MNQKKAIMLLSAIRIKWSKITEEFLINKTPFEDTTLAEDLEFIEMSEKLKAKPAPGNDERLLLGLVHAAHPVIPIGFLKQLDGRILKPERALHPTDALSINTTDAMLAEPPIIFGSSLPSDIFSQLGTTDDREN